MAFWNKKKKTDEESQENEEQEVESQPTDKAEPALADNAAPEEETDADAEPKSGVLKRALKALLIVLLLIVLVAAAFCVGIYMRIIDGDAASKQLKDWKKKNLIWII